MYKKHLNNANGSVLVIILVLFVSLVGITLYFIHSARLQADIKLKSQNDVNVISATAKIRSHLSTPFNCNATFLDGTSRNVSGGTLSAIRTCKDGNCFTVAGTGTVEPFINITPGSWGTGGTLPSNLRINQIRYDMAQNQNANPSVNKPALINIYIEFEKKVRDVTSRVTTTIQQYVSLDASGRIMGCPKGPNTIDIEGDRSCHYPWGDWLTKLPDTQQVTAYQFAHTINCNSYREQRVCNNTLLSGSFLNQSCIEDGDWSGWSGWSGCDALCGGISGYRHRYRACNNPSPDPGGLGCSGPSSESQTCVSAACP